MGTGQESICVITGASDGIGLVTAREIARSGVRVVLVCRDRQRGERALAAVTAVAGQAPPSLELADLSSQEQIHALARRLRRTCPAIDILVNNAAGAFTSRELTVDGIERTFAVNHIAPFLLTHLLRPSLEAGRGRIVTVASAAHRRGTIDFDNLQGERTYGTWSAYSNSKLCNILFTRALPTRWPGTRTTANCLHPGLVRTGLGDKSGLWLRLAWVCARPFMLSPEEGARTSVFLALDPSVAGVTGEYFSECKAAATSAAARDPALAGRLWDETVQLATKRGPLAVAPGT